MLDIFVQIYDTIFPPHESIKKIKTENRVEFVRFFRPHRFINSFALSDYTHEKVRAAITANKFHNYEPAADLLSGIIEHWLDTLPPAPTIFVPIPLSSSRQKERGYNQVSRVLAKVKKKDTQVLEALSRTRDTKPQTSLSREDRFKNIADAFVSISIKKDLGGHRIVIIDDVVTTGATMHAAHAALSLKLPKDCEVLCVAMAH
jgi:ComF family protein